MKKLLLSVLVLALVGYCAFKGTAWYFTHKALEASRGAGAFEGVVSANRLRSGLSGTVTLAQARYQLFRMTEPVTADAVHFQAASPVVLLRSLVVARALPSQWRLVMDGLELKLDPAMLKGWVVAGDQAAERSLFSPVCAPDHRQQLGSGDLIRMGVSALTGDATIDQSLDELRLDLNTAEAGSLEVHWPDARLSLADPGAVLDSSDEIARVTLRDAGLMRKVTAYCARESDMAVTAWADLITRSFREGLHARGYEPSQQLLALYRQWLTEGGELEMDLRPGEDTWGVPVNQPGDSESGQAELSVHYNQARVPGVYLLPWSPPATSEQTPVSANQREDSVAAGETTGPAWFVSSAAEAAPWLDRSVRVTLENGRVVEGRLAGITDERLNIARKTDGGEVAYPIPLKAIARFEVWRRADDTGKPVAKSEPTGAADQPAQTPVAEPDASTESEPSNNQ